MRSLILGAGGFLGLNLVDALHEAGVEPVCGSRRKAPRVALRRRKVALVHADLDDAASLRTAMAGMHTVYHLAGHYPALSLDPQGTLQLGVAQMQAVLDAAAEAGVGRLVYVSSTATVAPTTGRSTEAHTFDSPPDGVYHRLKWSMEKLAIDETRLDVRVACPGACIGPWDQRIGTSAPLVALANGHQPMLPNGILNIVDVRDAARGVVALGLREHAPPRVLLVGRNVQLVPFLLKIAARYGVAGPVELSRDVAERLAIKEEQRSEREGGRPKLSRELVDLIVSGVEIDARLSEESLGVTYTNFEDTLCAFEQWARARRILPRNKERSHEPTRQPRTRPSDPL